MEKEILDVISERRQSPTLPIPKWDLKIWQKEEIQFSMWKDRRLWSCEQWNDPEGRWIRIITTKMVPLRKVISNGTFQNDTRNWNKDIRNCVGLQQKIECWQSVSRSITFDPWETVLSQNRQMQRNYKKEQIQRIRSIRIDEWSEKSASEDL